MLHNPAYRKKYEIQLKEESPRIPLYKNFWQWENWGKQLLNLHLNYETIKPYPLERTAVAAKENPKVKLQALKEEGVILLDENTELRGIPGEAWKYQTGNSSALELVLSQYQEKKFYGDLMAEKFSTYRFAERKEEVIDLLQKICSVSVETLKIVEEMAR